MSAAETKGDADPAADPSPGPDETGPHETGPDEGPSVLSAEEAEARFERLQRILVWVGNQDVARALRNLAPAEVMLQPLPIRTALQTLRKKRDPVNFLGQNQYRAIIPLVAEAVSESCQDAVIAALGDAADHPTRADLLSAIGEIQEEFPASMIALMLAFVSITEMEAADLCAEILESEEIFAIPASAALPDG